jgi:hypothetical protein
MEIRNIVMLVIFVLGVVYVQFLQAQSVDEVINKYAAARGGKDKLNAINSVYMEGYRTMMDNAVVIKITRVQGILSRTDFEFGGSSGYIIITPTEGWSFFPMRSQKPDPIPQERLTTMQTELDIPGPLIDYESKGNKAELVGKEDIDGRQAYKVKLTLGTGKEIIYYFDTRTNLLFQSRQIRDRIAGNENDEKELITNYSDYIAVDGIMFPHTISNPGTGPGAGSITFSKIELNKAIDEIQYKPFN